MDLKKEQCKQRNDLNHFILIMNNKNNLEVAVLNGYN